MSKNILVAGSGIQLVLKKGRGGLGAIGLPCRRRECGCSIRVVVLFTAVSPNAPYETWLLEIRRKDLLRKPVDAENTLKI